MSDVWIALGIVTLCGLIVVGMLWVADWLDRRDLQRLADQLAAADARAAAEESRRRHPAAARCRWCGDRMIDPVEHHRLYHVHGDAQ
ncbi:MAG: hypothetical protein RLZ55_1453 [Actinomycetota bacterium]|jgi:hypothetical protein